MISLLFIVPASAYAASPNTNCNSIANDFAFAGDDQLWPSVSTRTVEGISAYINGTDRLFECIDSTGLDANSNISAWVALVGGSSNEIIQVGIIKCHTNNSPVSYSPCIGASAGQARYFYAWGRSASRDCGIGEHIPYAADAGAATAGAHRYQVYITGSTIYLKVDSTTVKTLPVSSFCWLSDRKGQAEVERHDMSDGAGTGLYPMAFTTVRLKESDGIFHTASGAGPSCNVSGYQASEFHCIRGTDSFSIYTTQN